MEEADTAFAHFEDALPFCDRSGYRPEYARTASDYASALLTRGQPGDQGRATSSTPRRAPEDLTHAAPRRSRRPARSSTTELHNDWTGQGAELIASLPTAEELCAPPEAQSDAGEG